MRITQDSQKSIETYCQNPDLWLLQAHKVKGEVSVQLMKKGFWSWLKINIGGRIGLFDRSTVKVQHIAGLLDQVHTLPKEFQDKWAAKKAHFEAKHFPLFKVRVENKKIVNLNIHESNARVSGKIIDHLRESLDSDKFPKEVVELWKLPVNAREHIFSSIHTNDLSNGGKDVYLSLSPPLWRSLSKEEKKNPVNSALILDRILTGKGEHYQEECLKMVKMGYRTIHVQLLPQHDGTIQAVISAD